MFKPGRSLLAAAVALGCAAAVSAASAQPGRPHAAAPSTCPVMKGAIKDPAKAPRVVVNNVPVFFCCADCPARFKADPAKYLTTPVKDPVNGKAFKVAGTSPKEERGGALFIFSSPQTKAEFDKNPAKYTKAHA